MASILRRQTDRQNPLVNIFFSRDIFKKGRQRVQVLNLNQRLPFLFFILLAGASLFFSPHNVHATGGAYTSTKHGGATFDTVTNAGVQRGVNTTDYASGVYFSGNAAAGSYAASECAHCHEMHSSFGESEPPPAAGSLADPTGGPNVYLGMADPTPEFCWYCHENMTLTGKIATNPAGNGLWGFYKGKGYYAATGHYSGTNSATMISPGYGASQPWPRTNRTSNLSGGNCLNCHTPHGIQTAAGAYDLTALPATKQTVAGNSGGDVTTNYLIPRQLIAWEEALCENCHQAGGPVGAKNIKDTAALLENTNPTPGSGHPIHNIDQYGNTLAADSAKLSGRHSLKNELNPAIGWNAYSSVPPGRHVECVDCHNPHVMQPGWAFQQSGIAVNTSRWQSNTGNCTAATQANLTAGPVCGPGVLKGQWGVSITTTTGAIGGRVEDTNIAAQNYSSLYVYQICLKCHSTFADSTLTSNATPSWTNRARWPGFDVGGATPSYLSNVALDYATTSTDVNNDTLPAGLAKGYHPVYAVGRNQPGTTLNCRWTQTTIPAAGCTPINPEVVGRATGVRNTTIGLSNNFVPPWTQDSFVTCIDCHQNEPTSPRGPHGSSRPYILRDLDPSITYTIVNDGLGGTTVSYSAFRSGWQTGNAYGTTAFSIATYDPSNACINCHRADVYGFFRQITARNANPNGGALCAAGGGTGQENCYPRYRYLSRQPHPADDMETYSFSDAVENGDAGPSPRGNVCLRCHAGGTTGGIHGNAGAAWSGQSAAACKTMTLATAGTANCFVYDKVASLASWPASNRLLNGVAWTGVRFGSTTTAGSCRRASAAPNPLNNTSCVNDFTDGAFTKVTTYNY